MGFSNEARDRFIHGLYCFIQWVLFQALVGGGSCLEASWAAAASAGTRGHFFIWLSENGHLGNRYAPENFEHMAEKISPRYVEIRGLFGFRCT